MDQLKELYIHAICGKGFPSMEFADKMEKLGMAKFTGNQWNNAWEWDKNKLKELTIDDLKNIYEKDGE